MNTDTTRPLLHQKHFESNEKKNSSETQFAMVAFEKGKKNLSQ
jgi:hypothetical protein